MTLQMNLLAAQKSTLRKQERRQGVQNAEERSNEGGRKRGEGEAAMPSAAEIFKAAETGQTELFEGLSPHQLLQLCSLRNEDSRSPLHVAASAGQAQIVKVLCGVSDPSQRFVNIEDEEGWTALHSAVSSGHVSITQILLEAGAFVSAVNHGGRTALHYAASKGWTKLAEILIEHGANVNQKDKFGCTPLHRAASAGHPEVCELLLEEGANVDMADRTGQTPLMYATICNDKQVSLLLIRHGADVDAEDKEGYTVLGRACDELRPALIDAAKVMLEG